MDQFSSQSLDLYCYNAKLRDTFSNNAKEMSVVEVYDMPNSLTISMEINEC